MYIALIHTHTHTLTETQMEEVRIGQGFCARVWHVLWRVVLVYNVLGQRPSIL